MMTLFPLAREDRDTLDEWKAEVRALCTKPLAQWQAQDYDTLDTLLRVGVDVHRLTVIKGRCDQVTDVALLQDMVDQATRNGAAYLAAGSCQVHDQNSPVAADLMWVAKPKVAA